MLKAIQASRLLFTSSQAAIRSFSSTSRTTLINRFAELKTRSTASIRKMSAAAAGIEEKYAGSLQFAHWAIAAGMLTCVGTVKTAQNIKDKQTKGTLMMIHKSTALLVLAMVVPRIALRLTTKLPAAVPGNMLEKLGANISHTAFYGFMIFMPVSGVIMGYYGGKGLPFFGYTIPGAQGDEKRPSWAKQAYKLHKQAGLGLEFLIPLHVGAVGYHMLKGQNILARMGIGSKVLKSV
eukprot:TRINITY_DN11204_c0_g1_i2.p2 TRINITY_DN11204_c0_g1~~TRINITY_DN11204_c0_g1_i2.p2  ORF type:complete len:236 (+),score=52.41 TRINITY_DN11204_c0_g1_i2:2696-3403(+)